MIRLFGLSVVVIVLFAGCTIAPPKQEPELKRVTAEELTTLLRQREASVLSMKGLFSAKVKGGLLPLAARVEGALYYRRPNALRLRGFSPIGNELFELVQVDDLYQLRLPMQGKVYTGRQSDLQDKEKDKLARLSQLSVWAIGGVLGTESIAQDETVELVQDVDRYRLDVYAPSQEPSGSSRFLVRRLWFDHRLLVVQEDRLGPNGEIDATIQYDDFRPLDESTEGIVPATCNQPVQLVRPFKIYLEDGRGQVTVQVTFHEIHHNLMMRDEDLGRIS